MLSYITRTGQQIKHKLNMKLFSLAISIFLFYLFFGGGAIFHVNHIPQLSHLPSAFPVDHYPSLPILLIQKLGYF